MANKLTNKPHLIRKKGVSPYGKCPFILNNYSLYHLS